jgi:antidote-toxin recognition MazE-like antitoxin
VTREANNRMRVYRERLRSLGLRPVQRWLPDTSSRRFRVEARRQSLLLHEDSAEQEILDFIERASDREGADAREPNQAVRNPRRTAPIAGGTDTKRSGQIAARSGEYEIRDSKGGHTGQERSVAGAERLANTPKPGRSNHRSRSPHNKGGRGR